MRRQSTSALVLLAVVLARAPAFVVAQNHADLFVVAAVRYETTGPIRDGALGATIADIGLVPGVAYRGTQDLTATLREAERVLQNTRVLTDISVAWRPMGLEDSGGATAIEVVVSATAAPSILPVPFYRYNSNVGHNPLAVLYWNNAFGTLTNLSFSAGYAARDWITPFQWDVSLRWSEIRLGATRWFVEARQLFQTSERATVDGELEWAATTMSTRAALGTNVPVGPFQWSPSVVTSATTDAELLVDTIGLGEPGTGSSISLSNRLGLGRVDWRGTLREGLGADAGVSASRQLASAGGGISFSGSGRVHAPLESSHPRIGVEAAGRAGGQWSFAGESSGLGAPIRGVLNNRVSGQGLVFLNAQMVVALDAGRRVGTIQLVPFVDVAATLDGVGGRGSIPFVGFGIDVVGFPSLVAGFQARVSIGVNALDGSVEIVMSDALHF